MRLLKETLKEARDAGQFIVTNVKKPHTLLTTATTTIFEGWYPSWKGAPFNEEEDQFRRDIGNLVAGFPDIFVYFILHKQIDESIEQQTKYFNDHYKYSDVEGFEGFEGLKYIEEKSIKSTAYLRVVCFWFILKVAVNLLMIPVISYAHSCCYNHTPAGLRQKLAACANLKDAWSYLSIVCIVFFIRLNSPQMIVDQIEIFNAAIAASPFANKASLIKYETIAYCLGLINWVRFNTTHLPAWVNQSLPFMFADLYAKVLEFTFPLRMISSIIPLFTLLSFIIKLLCDHIYTATSSLELPENISRALAAARDFFERNEPTKYTLYNYAAVVRLVILLAMTPIIIINSSEYVNAQSNICNLPGIFGNHMSTCYASLEGTENDPWLEKLLETLRQRFNTQWDSNGYQGLLFVELSSIYNGASEEERFLSKLLQIGSFGLLGKHSIDTSQRSIFLAPAVAWHNRTINVTATFKVHSDGPSHNTLAAILAASEIFGVYPAVCNIIFIGTMPILVYLLFQCWRALKQKIWPPTSPSDDLRSLLNPPEINQPEKKKLRVRKVVKNIMRVILAPGTKWSHDQLKLIERTTLLLLVVSYLYNILVTSPPIVEDILGYKKGLSKLYQISLSSIFNPLIVDGSRALANLVLLSWTSTFLLVTPFTCAAILIDRFFAAIERACKRNSREGVGAEPALEPLPTTATSTLHPAPADATVPQHGRM